MSLKVWLPLDGDLRNNGIYDLPSPVINTLTYVDGKIGKCGHGRLSWHLSEDILDNEWTVAMWFNSPVNFGSANNVLFCKNISQSSDCQIYFSIISNKTLNIGVNGPSSSLGYSFSFSTNTWYHVAATYDGVEVTLYLNGLAVKSGIVTTAKPEGRLNMMIDGRSTNETGTGYTVGIGMKYNDFRLYNHCLSAAEVHEIAQGLVLHYKLDSIKIKAGTNLVTGVKKGNRTTVLTDGRIGVQTTGENADTYFTVNLSESITNGTKYFLSCDASGISEGAYWSFPLGAQGNSTLPFKIYNGHNEYSFTANDINWGSNRLFMDDANRADWANKATFWNFELYKVPALEVEDSSGYGYNGISNNIITTSTNTPRYNLSSYFGAYNTPNIITENFSSLAPALTNCTITWWGKYDTAKTLLLTGQTTSYYIAASNNNNYYHSGVSSSSPIMYKDGIPGTYKCAADGWHFFCLANINLSTWTTLKINGYSSSWPLKGYISDFRIYCTPLLDTDIKLLYNIGMRVDNLGGVHAFEFEETSSSKNKLTKTGILNNNIIEPYLTLSDSSNWKLMLYHYVDKGNNLFTSSNATYCNDFGLYSRLRDINNYTYNGKYEFYVIQDDEEFRWTQTSQPTASSIAGLTTIEGYNNPVNGLAKANQSSTYIGYNAWWGACGCWTKYSTGGKTGIPGFGSHNGDGICEKYLALYVRVEKNNASFENSSSNSTEFIEI